VGIGEFLALHRTDVTEMKTYYDSKAQAQGVLAQTKLKIAIFYFTELVRMLFLAAHSFCIVVRIFCYL
jgi:hypothetical protein